MDKKGNFKKGAVEILSLHILLQRDCYGYEITQLINEYSDGIIKVPEGTLYPALYKLEENGYISEEKRLVGKRLTRVYYHLEEKGKQYLDELLEEYYLTHKGIQLILDNNIK